MYLKNNQQHHESLNMGLKGWPNGPVVATDTTLFHMEKHVSYWLRCLRSPLPTQYTSNDSNRITLAFFVISALDLLGALFTRTTLAEREEWINWVYHCQHPSGGFRGFPATDFGERRNEDNAVWDPANLPATYFALSTLCVLRDDLSRVDKKQCLRWLRSVQRSDGSFGELLGPNGDVEGGNDTRYGYCAMGTRWILRASVFGEVEGEPDVDVDKLMACVRKAEVGNLILQRAFCRSALQRAFANLQVRPTMEEYRKRRFMKLMVSDISRPVGRCAKGITAGFTYCAVAALSFVERLPTRTAVNPLLHNIDKKSGLTSVESTIRWLLSRLTTFVDEPDDDSDDDSVSSLNGFVGDGFNGDHTTSSDSPFLSTHSQTAFSSLEEDSEPDMPIPVDPHFESLSTQYTGLNGRANKIADTCYAFWVGGALDVSTCVLQHCNYTKHQILTPSDPRQPTPIRLHAYPPLPPRQNATSHRRIR